MKHAMKIWHESDGSPATAVMDALPELQVPGEGTWAERVAAIIQGTRKSRVGAAATPEQHQQLTAHVARFMSEELPIEMLVAWGAVKAYAHDEQRLGVDLADLLALARFSTMNQAVKMFHEPGMRIRVFVEDAGETALAARKLGLESHMARYAGELQGLCQAAGGVFIENETAILAAHGLTATDLVGRGRGMAKMFVDYWRATDGLPDVEHEQHPKFQELNQATGWRGPISAEARAYYLGRAANAYPELAGDELSLIWRVCTYLGIARVRHQIDFFGGSFFDKQGRIPPLRGSFVPYAPGTPVDMNASRITYRVKDSRSSHNTIPPWCGYGVREIREGKEVPTVVPPRSLDGDRHSVDWNVLVQHNGETILVRADLKVGW